MAKNSVWQKLKTWLTGGSKSSKPSGSKSTASSSQPKKKKKKYEEVVERQTERFNKRELLNNVRNVKEEPKQEEAKPDYTEKFKATKRTYKSMSGKDSGLADALDKKVDKLSDNKKTPPKPKSIAKPDLTPKHKSTALGGISEKEAERFKAKKTVAEANRKEQVRAAEKLKPLIDKKYDGKTKESKRRIKMGEYQSDPNVAKYETLKHPVTASLGRGALSGATFGLSELAINTLPTSKEMREAERLYQANKHRGAEFLGEMGGSLASFGLTSGLSKGAVSAASDRIAPNLTARLGESATEFVAKRPAVINAARKEALRKLGTTATEAEIARFARERAARIVAAVGEDMAINLTTGAVSDVAHSIIDSDNPAEFAKNMGMNAGMNLLLGGLTTVAPELYRGSDLGDSIRAIGDDVGGFGRDVAINASNKSGGIKLPDTKKTVEESLITESPVNGVVESAINNADEVLASGRNWIEGRDLQLWKSGNTLYVGDPNDYTTWKSFGRDIPENRAAAESEFNFVNNRRTEEEQARRRGKSKKTEPKKKSNEPERPDGVRKFTDKQLLDMKKKGEAGSLTKEEYDYYVYNRAEDDPFLEQWDNAGTNNKGKKKSNKKSKAEEAESVKTEAPATKTVSKQKLEKQLERSEKRLEALEEDIKKSSNASQYQQDSLSAQYTKELEFKKKTEARIKEAEESADGTITVNKRKKKPPKDVDESDVVITKGKEEIVDEPKKSGKKKGKKTKAQKTEADEAVKSAKETTVDADVEARKQAKSVKSLENKIENANKNIEKFEQTLKEKHKNGASEKSIKYTQEQRAKEMKKRKDLKRELEKLKASSEVEAKVEEPKPAKTKGKGKKKNKTEVKSEQPKSLDERIDKAHQDILDARDRGASYEELEALNDKFDKLYQEKKSADVKSDSVKEKALRKDAKVAPPEKPMSKAAEKRAKREEAKQRLDDLLDKAEKHQEAYDKGDADALKDLVATEREARQAFRDAGMSRDDAYRESKKLFDEHEKALKQLEKKRAKAKEEATAFYKSKVDESISKAKEADTVEINNKKYSAVNDSPFDEASTRTTRTKPTFTSAEEKAAKVKNAKNKKAKEAAKKLDKKANTFRRNPSPRGEGLHKNVYESVKGESLDEAITPPTFKDYLDAKKTYAKGQASGEKEVVSRAGTSLMNATTAEAQRDFLREGWQDGNFNYVKIKNREKYAEVMQHWVDEPDAVARDIIRYNDDISKLSVDKAVDMHYQSHCVMKMLRKELDNPALSEAERESVKEIYSAAASLTQRLSSISGQVNQFQGVMVGCSPARRSDNALENIVDMLDKAKGFRKNTKVEIDGKMVPLSGNASERRNQIRALLLDNDEISATLKRVYDASTEEEYGEAMEELLRKSYKLNSATGFDYLQQWRYLAMLGNPKTHLRNIVGNLTFGGIRKISNAIRSGLESGLEGWATKHGLEMEMHGGLSANAWKQAQSEKFVTDEAGRSAWESFNKHSKEILGDQKYNTPEMKGFLAELNTKALTAEDDFFRGRTYREQYIKGYNKYAKKGEITDAIKEKLHAEALKESQIATFNEFNELAQLLAKSQNGLYDANATVGKKVASMASNALLPFTKVPANILKQSVNYSPAGLVKGYAHIIDAAKKGDSQLLNKAIDEMASGLTGTGVAALGFVLGKNTDIFTTNAGSEDAAAKFKKQQGVQNYSVMFNGANGKQYSMTLDWLVPTSSTFFMGVEIANQFKNGLGGANFGEAVGNLSQVTSRVIDPVLETSMLSGIYNIVEDSRKSASYDDQQSFANIVIRELVQSYLSSYIPTLSGQIARTAYGADKMVVGDSDTEYWVNSMKVKMGLANTDILGERLGDDVNAYGEVKNKKDGSFESYAKSFAKNVIIPANIQEVSLSDIDKQKIKEYEDYVAAGGDPADKEYLFPKKSYKKNFTVGKKGADPMDVKLSNQQVSLYNQAKTTGGSEGMRAVLENIMFNRYDKDSSGKRTILKNGYTSEQKEKLIQKFDGKSLREVEEWLYKQPQFRSATEEEQKKAINALWNYSQQGKAQGAKRVGEQAVILDQGGDINEYNFKNELSKNKQLALMEAVNDGIVTYEEAVDFARYAGKTYYYENDEGGTASTYYNKKQMLEYLESEGYSEEKAEALFNAFKASNAKPYGSSSGGRGRYRRGYRRWRRYGSGKKKGKPYVAPKIKQSVYKASSSNSHYKSLASSLRTRNSSTALPTTTTKIEPPKVKFKKYEV